MVELRLLQVHATSLIVAPLRRDVDFALRIRAKKASNRDEQDEPHKQPPLSLSESLSPATVLCTSATKTRSGAVRRFGAVDKKTKRHENHHHAGLLDETPSAAIECSI